MAKNRKPAKKEARTAKMKPPGKTTPWYKRARIKVAAALAGTGLLFALGALNHHVTTIRPTGAPRILLTGQLRTSLDDPRHLTDTPGRANATVRPGNGLNIGMPDEAKCLNCHAIAEMPKSISAEVLDKAQKVAQLFPSECIHSDIRDGLILMSPERIQEDKGDINMAHTERWGIYYPLTSYADPTIRKHIVAHETAHFFTARRDDYVNENWAAAANLLVSDPKQLTDADDDNLGWKYAAVLRRIQIVQDKLKKAELLKPPTSSAPDTLERLAETVTRNDQDAFKPVFKESFREYRKNTLFWDTAVFHFQNPWLPFDARIAQDLFARKDPHFMASLADRRTLDKNEKEYDRLCRENAKRRFEFLKRKLKRNPSTEELNTHLDYHAQDVLTTFTPANTENIDARQISAAYYAILFRKFCRPDGSYRYDAVSQTELMDHARRKLGMLDKEVDAIGKFYAKSGQWLRLDRPGKPGRLYQNLQMHKRRLGEIEQMIRTRRFIHE